VTATIEGQIAALNVRVAELEKENAHLRVGLASRIVIEQAKGVLIERLDLPPEEIFELLRTAARRSNMKLHVLAAEVLQTRVTPDYILQQIERLIPGDVGSGWIRKT
jgi:AmiR/NasT family two-component response regulator